MRTDMNTRLADPRDHSRLIKKHQEEMLPLWEQYAYNPWLKSFHKNREQLLQPISGYIAEKWSFVTVQGMVPEDAFWEMLSYRVMPVNQDVRHESNWEYCPLPDRLHDLGHVVQAMTDELDWLLYSFGVMSLVGDKKILDKLSKIYWAIVEFGLIKTKSGVKAIGGGLLSSQKEIVIACTNSNNTQRPFDLEDICNWEYGKYDIQDRHYIIESPQQVVEAIKSLNKRK